MCCSRFSRSRRVARCCLKQQRATRRLLENLEQRIGGVAVHFLGAVDDDDAPTLLCRGQPHKAGDLAYVLDDDLAAPPTSPRIIGALDGQKVSVTARGDAAERIARGVYRQPGIGTIAGLREQEAGEPEGERRLADTARPGQQQRMRQPSSFRKPSELSFGVLVAQQIRVLTWRKHAVVRKISQRGWIGAMHASRWPRSWPPQDEEFS